MTETTGDTDLELLVVGLDAGCRPVLEPLFDSGAVPTLRQLIESGTDGPLESQIPPWTASAWPSLYTGKNPGKHGVYDFLAFDGYDWDVVNSTHVRERPVWELLDEHGYTSVVVNLPVTHPARPFDGALIPGMTAPEDPDCHPQGVLEDVEIACGGYRIYPQSGPEANGSIESYERTAEKRGKAFRYLCRRMEPEFGFLQFQITDSVFHERPGDGKAIRAVYEAVDRQIERTLEETEPDNVLIVSDHGMGEMTGHEFRINEFLRDGGYLTGTEDGGGMPNWSKSWENDLLEGEEAGEHEESLPEKALNVAARFGLTTQRVAAALDRVGLKEPIGTRVPNDLIRAASEGVDFPESRVYMRSKSELGLRINLEGREPDGRVPESEYERVREEVIDELSAVRTPDGEPMFDAVVPRERYFEGPHVDKAPDIVTVPADFDNALAADLGTEQFGEPMEPWNHKRTGIVAARGPAFDEDVPLEEAGATIFDVAPTICALFDVPIDAAMDGRPLPIVDPGAEAEYPAYEPEPVTATDDRVVEDRLSDLGYL
ncbi:Predicted phosphohydrolase or phosphomutase, AlkP superfamily [Halobiforma haloterrestris]|uniref:Predicted phosphohydrolase or phosphomutase, AlkP superfamily n=1 Tax=Natronobacterium haloterrestre TaxID=148448 RepID=A0A1I1FAC2_NATHA|nr:alkaline phosphatase family protein [Halobiforma haloterrestris]SFB94093.1 Predicted phosphohydrolase or phosphomutase, AlkP superfamily [Halobiforma haloterrestris]